MSFNFPQFQPNIFYNVYPGQCDEGQQNNIKLQEIKEPRIIMQIISSFNE